MWEGGDVIPLILLLGTIQKWMVSFTPRQIYLRVSPVGTQ